MEWVYRECLALGGLDYSNGNANRNIEEFNDGWFMQCFCVQEKRSIVLDDDSIFLKDGPESE